LKPFQQASEKFGEKNSCYECVGKEFEDLPSFGSSQKKAKTKKSSVSTKFLKEGKKSSNASIIEQCPLVARLPVLRSQL